MSSDRIWVAFGASSVLFLGVLAISPVKDYFREYRGYQEAYRARLLETASSSRELHDAESESVHVRQIWVPELDNAVDRCVSCHLGVENPKMARAPLPYRLHPATPHTPEELGRFGCVSCHRGQGRATAKHDAHGHDVEDWSSPLLPLRYVEASCGACHRDEVVAEASRLSEGRTLIRTAGCPACHDLPGLESWSSHAPDLDGLSQKMSVTWLRSWLRSPRASQPRTFMPDFHLEDAELDALVAFLWAQPPKPGQDLAELQVPPGDADSGSRLFRESRCVSCHTIEGRGGSTGPELSTIGSRASLVWLYAFLERSHDLHPSTVMPQYRFDSQEAADLAAYLHEELRDPEATDEDGDATPYRPPFKQLEDGRLLYKKYACAACHALGGHRDTTRSGPDLREIGGKAEDLLDYGARGDIPHHLPEWLAAKVTSPRSFRDGLRMPDFGFEADQVTAIVTALLSNVPLPPPEYRVATTPTTYAPPGRFGELVSTYRCLSCHQVEGMGGDISTAPLTYEGSKVNEDWLKQYLLVPATIRPILTERMLPLGLTDEEAAFMASFMENVYRDNSIPVDLGAPVTPEAVNRGASLFFERYGCEACHQRAGRGGYVGPPLDDVPRKLKPGFVAWWIQGPQRWRADVICPDQGIGQADARDIAAFLVSSPTEPEVAR